ncbi:tetratricopeptide repeat protein [Salipiger thiooxidans]|uniref:tetratricopeptide repeat protein n=1 Tax=Salipiger thiooxidans TaxID=282683 RepID=UPI001CD51B47|nr:tetratricopeptide repeat protein [Salipiger thiooxidans]MCA0847005.1 tetratricopeptide repeat protein [Salipiger thiooxidans]
MLCGGLLLTGCKSAEEKAEIHFRSGMSFLEQNDEDRALVEFLNVFRYEKHHEDALRAYADIMRDQGHMREAFGSYMALVERNPDAMDVRVTLAEMAIRTGNWQEARRQGEALQNGPLDDARTRAILLALDYDAAALKRDDAERARLAAEAQELTDAQRTEGTPQSDILLRIVIDNQASAKDPAIALPTIDAALDVDPEAEDLNLLKLRILTQTGQTEATGAQLQRMVGLYPDNAELRQALISWHVMEGNYPEAETLLRTEAGADTGDSEGHVKVVRFLQATKGPEAARAELERLQAANEGTELGRFYAAMVASMAFEAGQTEDGIKGMRAALDGAEESAQTREHRVTLAKMLLRSGDETEARTLVDGVLKADAANAEALKLQARWLIDADQPQEAILALRTALGQNPQDADALTEMARAHERNGEALLMGDRLAMAYEASNAAPAETLRYARYLLGDGQSEKAAAMLEDLRRRDPGNLDVLLLLSNLYLGDRSWAEARAVLDAVQAIDTDEARQAALPLQAAIMQGQNRTADSLAMLEAKVDGEVSGTDPEAVRSVILIVQTHIRDGEIDEARAYLDEVLARSPDVPDLRLLDADLNALMGRTELAERGYRELIADAPENETAVRKLASILSASGRHAEAATLLAAAIERMPGTVNLVGLRANMLERDGQFEASIAALEELYAQDSGNIYVANNLASLLTTHGGTPVSLERASTIAKRLRGSKIPAFQDTYGWIAYRQGNYETAVEYLAQAAAGLPSEPVVQAHLALAYAGLGRAQEARSAFDTAVTLAGGTELPEITEARETLAALADADKDAAKP